MSGEPTEEKFLAQRAGLLPQPRPASPDGPGDKGALYAILSVDVAKQKIFLEFGEPCSWLSMTVAGAEALIENLQLGIRQIRKPQ
ncbi:MAG TPA: hypothetical protein VGH74_15505 [Planctomycetaceae bacterium]